MTWQEHINVKYLNVNIKILNWYKNGDE